MIGQQVRTRIRRAFGDDDGNKIDVFFFSSPDFLFLRAKCNEVKAKGGGGLLMMTRGYMLFAYPLFCLNFGPSSNLLFLKP